ncbi:UNKNOWN [Stylonychia lemnae]|uniref:Acyltransferase 3 domain-containing protein n=1 Tax=Stylonychia lemnae TaxID=5949 RepID=A0A078B3F5_STYLE|nr:UNKNOWN [Stylonychia lemnae]|eukprot:CDW88038.1 UNKNOWN [Stylonychia lemnae]
MNNTLKYVHLSKFKSTYIILILGFASILAMVRTFELQKPLLSNEKSNLLMKKYSFDDSSSSMNCYNQILNYTTNFLKEPFSLINMAQSRDFFEVGSPEICEEFSEFGRVISLKQEVKGQPGSFKQYFCVPKECDQNLAIKINRIMKRLSPIACKKSQYNVGNNANNSQNSCIFTAEYPEDQLKQQKDDIQSGFLVWIIVICSYSTLVLVSTFYDMIIRFRNEKLSLEKLKDLQQSLQQKDSLNKTILQLLQESNQENVTDILGDHNETQGTEDLDQGQTRSSGQIISNRTNQQNSGKKQTNTMGFSALGRFWNHRSSESAQSKVNIHDNSNNASFFKQSYAINGESTPQKAPSISNFLTEQQSMSGEISYKFIHDRKNHSYLTLLSLGRNFDIFFAERTLDEQELNILDGLKVLVFLWIWIVQSITMNLDKQIMNKWRLTDWSTQSNILLGLAASSQIGIDVFYILSAFFMTYKIIRIAKEYNGISLSILLQVYIQRLIRILPVYWFLFITSWILLWHLEESNVKNSLKLNYENCSDYWWTIFVTINNLVPQETDQKCFYWGSFISTELQLFTFLPIIMILYTKFSRVTVFILLILLTLATILNFNLFFVGDYKLGYQYLADINIAKEYGISPFTRIDSYIFGILVAFVYEQIIWFQLEARAREKQQYFMLNQLHISHVAPFFLIISSFVFFLLHVIFYFNINWSSSSDQYTRDNRIINSVLMAIGKIFFFISLLQFMTYIFVYKSRLLQHFLGSYFFQGLSKLILGAYLVMPIITKSYLSLTYQTTVMTSTLIIYQYSLIVIVCFGISLLTFIMIEQPIGDLLRLLTHDMIRICSRKQSNES